MPAVCYGLFVLVLLGFPVQTGSITARYYGSYLVMRSAGRAPANLLTGWSSACQSVAVSYKPNL
jgi:hypothetical protein